MLMVTAPSMYLVDTRWTCHNFLVCKELRGIMVVTMFRTALISLFITSTAIAETWTVDDDGAADFDSIQAAIDAAQDGDEIVVMPGTYTGTGYNVIDPLSKLLWIHSSDGPETTIIDGQASRRGINCRAFETAETIFEGLTISGCYATEGKGNGSGMYCRNSSPTLINCMFKNNSSSNWGGGVYLEESGSLFVNCQFKDNYAERWGGAIFIDDSDIELANCTFEENSTDVSAGGILLQYSTAAITNCSFTSNSAKANGGGLFCFFSNPVVMHCVFTSNYVGGEGGGVRCFNNSSPTLINCTFSNNTAYDTGGAMANNPDGVPLVSTSYFCSNTPTHIYGPWDDGGGNTMVDSCQYDCPDVTGDGFVNILDVLSVIDQWGLADSPADTNNDGVVDVSDLFIVIGAWGSCE